MTDPINFDIDSLVVRYQLHPERRDVFVEGNQDQGLVRTFVEKYGDENISVFSISVVNVSAHLIEARSLPRRSRRSEVITLAFELESKGVPPRQAACIADADFEYLLPRGLRCSLLLLTDFTSMELYAFFDEALHRVLILVSPNTSYAGATLLADLTGPLQFLFSALATNVDLRLGLEWIDSVEKFFGISGGRIQFDGQEFMKRYLVDRVPAGEVQRFTARFDEIQSMLSSSVRCRIRGHDFIRVLTWYLKKVEGGKHLQQESVRQMLYATLRPDDLAGHPMFSSLLGRLGSPALRH